MCLRAVAFNNGIRMAARSLASYEWSRRYTFSS